MNYSAKLFYDDLIENISKLESKYIHDLINKNGTESDLDIIRGQLRAFNDFKMIMKTTSEKYRERYPDICN